MSAPQPSQTSRRRALGWVAGLCFCGIVLGLVWTAGMRSLAASELRAAGFWPGREDIWQEVRNDWRNFFKRETWHVERKAYSERLTQGSLRDLDTLIPAFRRLGIEEIQISHCPELENLHALKGLPSLTKLSFYDCTALRNVDGLEGLTVLQRLVLMDCTSLENVDALHGLPSLQWMELDGCPKLPPESIAALKASLPTARIFGRPSR